MKNDAIANSKIIKIGILSVSLLAACIFLFFSDDFHFGSSTSKFKPDLEASPPNGEIYENGAAIQEITAEKTSEPISILFLGDMMFDRWIRQIGEKKGYDYIFQEVDGLLNDNELVVANLEGPITDRQSISVGSEFETKENYIFTFNPQVAKTLIKHNIGLVNLGNNHILNFKTDGLSQTKKNLDEAGVKYFCDPNNPGLRIANYELQGIKIAFVCYNQFEKDAFEKTKRDIGEVKGKSNIVILYAHWGKEYETTILRSVEVIAHQFIDSGVDLIIGSHPHVIQEKEEYKGKSIYYSLGNFIFDQYFDSRTTEGLAVKAIINSDKVVKTQEFRLNLKNNGQTGLK